MDSLIPRLTASGVHIPRTHMNIYTHTRVRLTLNVMWTKALLINSILTASKASWYIVCIYAVSFSATWGWHYNKVTGRRRPEGHWYWKHLCRILWMVFKTGGISWNMHIIYYFTSDESNGKVNKVKDFSRGSFTLCYTIFDCRVCADLSH